MEECQSLRVERLEVAVRALRSISFRREAEALDLRLRAERQYLRSMRDYIRRHAGED